MSGTIAENNAATLAAELEWLRQVIETRLCLYFGHEALFKSVKDVPVPALNPGSTYADFIIKNNMNAAERLVLILSLAPCIKPEILDAFFVKNTTYDRKFSEFGGLSGNTHAGFIPTGETALFLLAGEDIKERFLFYPIFHPEYFLVKHDILKLEPVNKNEPPLHGRLALSRDFIECFISGSFPKPDFSEDFPAKLITTDLDWDDVVLAGHTLEGINEIKDWIEHGHVLLNGMGLGKRLKPGYKSLFYGPPGTGKTLTATLLGKSTNRDVYKIDLSLVVSKYIGETEKNLAKTFNKAEHKDWILFFDEADALFGKRTELNSSHDRFANQEVAYLLQRIEDFPGVVILASNLNDNIDKAFLRRFQSVIHFPMPDTEERYNIWKQSFSEKIPPAKEVNLRKLAEKHKLSGGSMMNVIRYCSLKAVKNKKDDVPLSDIEEGIRKELQKDGIILA